MRPSLCKHAQQAPIYDHPHMPATHVPASTPPLPSISAHADAECRASCTQAFTAATDRAVFLAAWRGHGLVPGLRDIEAPQAQAVGSVRTVRATDGSTVRETVRAWEPGRRHAYTLSGFAPPLRWLLTGADAEWTFADTADGGCRITWRYAFTPRSRPASWLLRRLLLPSMQRAMQDCLDRLRTHLNAAKP